MGGYIFKVEQSEKLFAKRETYLLCVAAMFFKSKGYAKKHWQ